MTGGWTKGEWSVHCVDAKPVDGDDGVRFFDILAGDVWKSDGVAASVSGYIAVGEHIASVWKRGGNLEERQANALLIAEAGTVANETGLSPRQLADQRAELLAALDSALECFDIKDGLSIRDEMAIKHAAAVIAKCTGAA